MASDVDPADLYGLPLPEFVPARDALARELRAAGRREQSAAVKRARKPTLAAWALNQAARRHPDEVSALLAAGRALAAEQQSALAGDATGLREAGRALTEAVLRVGERAAGFLERPSPLQRERITATLRAAVTDETGADLLRRGVLVEDLEAAGFGLSDRGGGAGAGAAPKAPRRRERTGAIDEARRELRRREAEAEAARVRAQRRAERAEVAARRAAEALRVEAEEAAAEAVAAGREAQAAAGRLADAERAYVRSPDAT